MRLTARELIVGTLGSLIAGVIFYLIGIHNGYGDGLEQGKAKGRQEALTTEAGSIRETLEKAIRDELTGAILDEKCKAKIEAVEQTCQAKLDKANLEYEAKIAETRRDFYQQGVAAAEQQNVLVQFLDWYGRKLNEVNDPVNTALREPNDELQQQINAIAQAMIDAVEQQRSFIDDYRKILNGEHDQLRTALKNKDYKRVNEILLALTKAFEIRRQAIMQKIKELQTSKSGRM